MNGMIRRRGMREKEEISLYPFISDYPEFNEFGTFVLNCLTTSTTNTNVFIKSASTPYTYCGGAARNTSLRVVISESYIDVYRIQYANRWIRKAFVGFPVLLKRCTGTESSSPTATFEVTKEA